MLIFETVIYNYSKLLVFKNLACLVLDVFLSKTIKKEFS